jgi:hypothetical protein
MRRVSSERVPSVTALRKIHGKKAKKKPKSRAERYRIPSLRRYCTMNKKPNTNGRYSNMGLTRLASPMRIPVKSAKVAEGLDAKREIP